ncbi:MAG TPA: hypothetical protein VGS41_11585 [Chthonomonadales bacterium]|nr:hypothetical protein [Chthonomonadales bacterium]
MKRLDLCASVSAIAALAVLSMASLPAAAQYSYHHRQQTKNQWRNIGIGSAALGALGFLTHNNTLGWVGVAGGLYSASRYEADRRSQNRIARRRYEFYRSRYHWYHGHRYVRREVWRHHHRYYEYVRG